MPNDQFSRLVRFAQRTGDRLIVTDPEGREPIVIMSLDEYESLLDGAMGPGRSFSLPPLEEGEDDELPEFIPPLEVMEDIPIVEAAMDTPGVHQPRPMDTRMTRENTPRVQPAQKNPFNRQNPPSESGEEQFYLEPI